MIKEKFDIEGMMCASCSATIGREVGKMEGVENVNVSLVDKSMIVEYNQSKTNEKEIIDTVTKAGYEATPHVDKSYATWLQNQRIEDRKKRITLFITLSLVILLMIFAMGPMIAMNAGGIFLTDNPLILIPVQLVLLIPIIILNFSYFIKGFKALFTLHPNMDSLVAIGSTAAILYGLYAFIAIIVMTIIDPSGYATSIHSLGMNLYFESAGTIIGLVSLGKYLESKSMSSTMSAIYKLMDLAPEKATVRRDGKDETVPVKDILKGDVLVIRPGERIPLDGMILQGYANMDESSLTGEPLPIYKKEGDSVISGTLNTDSSFTMVVQKVGNDTTLNKIVELVKEASSTKASMAKLVDTVAYYFVPAVMLISIITFIVWIFVSSYDFNLSFNFAISVLVISCPCALGLATPMATMVGAGKGAQNGILIKSAQGFENLASTNVAVFDKTGTMTTGKMTVKEIDLDEEELSNVAAVEMNSNHPISKAFVKYVRERNHVLPEASNCTYKPGLGMEGEVNGHVYRCGNIKFVKDSIEKSKIDELSSKVGSTVTYVTKDGKFIGQYSVGDAIKPSARRMVELLQAQGIKVVMLTGDNKASAEKVAKEIGIDSVISDVKPDQKLDVISKLKEDGSKVLMVGDGINDSPSLMKADIGMAIGAGSDIAIESADIILITEDLLDVVSAIKLSRKVVKNIKMNLFWAFFYNVIAIPVAAGVFYFNPVYLKLDPMIASLCMALSSLTVVLNALRLNLFKREE